MSRSVTSTTETALATEHGYKPIAKLEIYPSLVAFDALTRNNAIPNADTLPASDDPMRQDIAYDATAGLVTFYADGDLKYALDGDATPVTSVLSSSVKPGVFGSKLYALIGTNVIRYSINWSQVAAKSTNPFSSDATLVPTDTIVAVHGISETECLAIGDGDGGLSIAYFSGTTEYLCPSRFMFPSMVDWDGSDRDMESLGIFSTGFRLGNRVYVYISNASAGIVEGIFYDINGGVWSDIFTAMPTDIDISLCEFRIANSFVKNNRGYIVGQFIRSDIYQTDAPYTLIMRTSNGERFSIDRFSFVSGLGYRFLGIVGSDNNLYLANSNRVCEAVATWVYHGDDDTYAPVTNVSMDDIISLEGDAGQIRIRVAAGDEQVYNNTHYTEGSRLKLYYGYKTGSGDEYNLYSTYIIANPKKSFADGGRGYTFSCVQEAQWKLSGLSMPFYAEWFGLSSIFDPMTDASGKLYAAPSNFRTSQNFQIDFWDHEGYANIAEGITATDFHSGGGISAVTFTGTHKTGIITKQEVKYILGSGTNPKITSTTLTVKLYGWSKTASGSPDVNDIVNLILITCDEDGKNEETHITTDTKRWPITWTYQAAGDKPIILTVSGLTADTYIKKIGLVFQQTNTTETCPARVEFVNNVEVPISLSLGNTPWEAQGDGTFKVPGSGQPFIMFSQRPYNAQNFHLSAAFENTVTGGIAGYPVGVGLVGLAEDASNFILARYDKVSQEVQLVITRNGIETELASASPGWAVGDYQEMQFAHRDGHFEVSMYRESTTQHEIVLSYDWIASNGFMYTSRTVTKKTGIWGGIMAPTVKIIAYGGNAQEGVVSSDGIAIDPLADITDFPSSGQLYMEGNIYSYTSKVAPATHVIGPHQLRNTGIYQPPFGNGSAGLEMLYFDWYESDSTYAGKFIGLDNGNNFISTGSLWRIYITTAGQKIWLRNRSRHYSANPQIAKASITTSTRVYIGAGGFNGVSLVDGSRRRHSFGTQAILNLTGTIVCYWFMGVGGEQDTTVRELIGTTCNLCGTEATFPGDYYDASLTVNGETSIFQDDYAEGCDFEFTTAAPEDFEIRTNIKIVADNYDNGGDFAADTGLKLVFADLGSGSYSLSVVSTPSGTLLYKYIYSSGTLKQHYRILFHENSVTVYHNYKWVASVTFDELNYIQTNAIDIKAYSASSITFSDVYVRDLSDWREAIYIDLETDGSSSIGAIIQERPVEIYPNADGTIRFYYEYTRPEVTLLTEPYNHDHETSLPSDGASDGIVYGMNDVKTIVNSDFAMKFGLATRILRYPNLGAGAIEAAYRSMAIAYESKDKHTLRCRPDVRVEEGDLLHFSYTLSGTGTNYSGSCIVEGISISLSQSGKKVNSSMTILGRGYVA